MTDDMTAEERFMRTPRPLSFIRVRVDLDTSDYLNALLERDRDDMFDDIAKWRTEGRTEDDPEMAETREDLGLCIQLLRNVQKARIDLVGPRRE